MKNFPIKHYLVDVFVQYLLYIIQVDPLFDAISKINKQKRRI